MKQLVILTPKKHIRHFVPGLLLLLLTVACSTEAKAQIYSVRGNALALLTGTLNIGTDIAVSSKTSFDVSLYVNPVSSEKYTSQFVGIQPGFRFWRFEPNAGLFFGAHLSAGYYNVGGEGFTRKGYLAGPGGSVGYCWLISKRFSLGVEGGVGLLYMKEEKRNRETPVTEDEYIYHNTRFMVAPTKLDVSFVYLF